MSATLSQNVASQNPGSLAGRVERAVAEWIFRGELTAGQKLTEQEVAERLDVSRGPVREAFRALADVGLLQIEQNRGAYVRKIDFEEAVEIHDVYSALEELAARSAARQLSGVQIEELKRLVEAMDDAAEAEDLDRYYALNLGFHQGLAEGSGNRRLLTIYTRLLNELHLFRRFVTNPNLNFYLHRRLPGFVGQNSGKLGIAGIDGYKAHDRRMTSVRGAAAQFNQSVERHGFMAL